VTLGAIFKEDRRDIFAECDVLGRDLFGSIVGIATGDEYHTNGQTENDARAQGEISSFHRIRSSSGFRKGC
jgi:hypothetical protein